MNRRDEILQAAGDLFRRQGYHGTSMRDLARALDVQGSTLYAHIGSKQELLLTIVEDAADDFLQAAAEIDPSLPPAERLRALVRVHFEVVARELPRASVFYHEWAHLPEELRAEVIDRRDAYQRHFHEAIADGAADGTFLTNDVDLATLFALSALNWTYQWLHTEGRLGLDVLADRYADLLLRALGATGTGGAPEGGPPEYGSPEGGAPGSGAPGGGT